MEPFICNGLGLHTVEKQSPVHNFRCQSFKGPLFFDFFHRLTTSYDLLPYTNYTRCATSVVMHLKNVKNVTVAGNQTGVWVKTLVPLWFYGPGLMFYGPLWFLWFYGPLWHHERHQTRVWVNIKMACVYRRSGYPHLGYRPVSSNLACWKIHHVYPFSSMIFPLPRFDWRCSS